MIKKNKIKEHKKIKKKFIYFLEVKKKEKKEIK